MLENLFLAQLAICPTLSETTHLSIAACAQAAEQATLAAAHARRADLPPALVASYAEHPHDQVRAAVLSRPDVTDTMVDTMFTRRTTAATLISYAACPTLQRYPLRLVVERFVAKPSKAVATTLLRRDTLPDYAVAALVDFSRGATGWPETQGEAQNLVRFRHQLNRDAHHTEDRDTVRWGQGVVDQVAQCGTDPDQLDTALRQTLLQTTRSAQQLTQLIANPHLREGSVDTALDALAGVKGGSAKPGTCRAAAERLSVNRSWLMRLYTAQPATMVSAVGVDLLAAAEQLALVHALTQMAKAPRADGQPVAAAVNAGAAGLWALLTSVYCSDAVLGALPWAYVGDRAVDAVVTVYDHGWRAADPDQLVRYLARQQNLLFRDGPAAWAAFPALATNWPGTVAELLSTAASIGGRAERAGEPDRS